jgi:hypothetical protein
MEAGRSADTLAGPRAVLDEIWKAHQHMDRPAKAVMKVSPA